MKQKIKICLACSAGGHFHQLNLAIKNIDEDFYWVTLKTRHTHKILKDKKHYFLMNFEMQHKYSYIINSLQALWHLMIERPKVIISTGAGIAVPTMYFGKKLFKTKIIYIISAANVDKPSRTPYWVEKYTDVMICQWPELTKIFSNAINIGVL